MLNQKQSRHKVFHDLILTMISVFLKPSLTILNIKNQILIFSLDFARKCDELADSSP